MKIGFIGLGIMGSRMAANLQKGGHSLVVYNRTRDKARLLLEQGAKWADSPADLAVEVEILFTMLAHPDAVREAALGENGFLSRFPSGLLWVDCSTVNPSFSKEIAGEARSRGIRFLDAPVTGSKEIAAAGKLVLWVGGDSSVPSGTGMPGKSYCACRRAGDGHRNEDGDESIAGQHDGGIRRRDGSGPIFGPVSRRLV